ncbi:MAG: ABC transporter permease [Nitrospiraceae bacterium]|nr:ABC transporter permease [Nitrospiraceae bacterium]
MLRFLALLGGIILRFTETTGRVLLLLLQVIKMMLIPPLEIRNTFKQALEIGVRSVPVVLVTAVFTGMVLALQTYTGFKRFGAEALVGSVVALSMTREMGPVLTGLIVAGRAGAAMAAELGTMRVTEQIDALETLATDPVKYLIVPRFISGLVVMPMLTVVADMIGILGGYAIAVWYYHTSSILYWKRAWDYLELSDLYGGLIKASFFGGMIALICCYEGFYTEGGAEGVGKATTGAVVISFMTILISDYFLTAWLIA